MFGAFARLLEPIRFAFDGDDLGVVDQAVDQRDDAGRVGEHLAPFGERPVDGDDGGLVFVATADDLEQQVGVAVAVGDR
nr:hypothetical protein [Pseudomonas alloputida]